MMILNCFYPLIKGVSDYVECLELKKEKSLAEFYKINRCKFDEKFLFEKTLKFTNFELDTQIVKKFKNLETIHVNSAVDEKLLEKLISDYGWFNNFYFKNTNLSQDFFNNLQANAVLKLEIYSNAVNLNLRFLFKLKFLECFKTDIKLKPNFIEKLLIKLKYLKVLHSNQYSLNKPEYQNHLERSVTP